MALRIALDSNRCTDFFRPVPETVQVVRTSDEVWLPFIVLGELRAGFLRGDRARQNEHDLIDFLMSPRVSVLLADESTTHIYAELHAACRRSGNPIPTNDLWIAALVRQHGLALYSRDTHFEKIPGLLRV
jgi:tRNA(fMet)-specific endonuclease VapC